ncbi:MULTISPECIES: DUF2975 domain-containing protein [Myroides]|uniref:DUF2975 domain-containing protein n=1 Tax=Myroides TaxID=76831 RepID=UPI000280A53B|nr:MULTISPECIES: DUF2975 domain-containing protein [Myroides]APA91173.1 hypothetical protein BK054_02810 [Myroides sp. ZB35]EKB02485.1 hypothetical protein HMPREF9711_03270 [Myroides odoratimimus CCUG 3837]
MKLKILTVLLIFIYALSFINEFNTANITGAFNRGREQGSRTENNIHYITVKSPKRENSEFINTLNNDSIEIEDSTSILRIEDNTSNILLTTSKFFIMFLFTIALVYSFSKTIRYLKKLFKGNYLNLEQITRLKQLAYALLLCGILGNLVAFIDNYEASRIASLYNLEAVKGDFNFTMFFIPLILLMIVEVLKQHLRLKEDAELTI